MATLRRNQDVELHYYDDDFTEPWGAAPTMLLQHGFSRSGKFWYNWVPLLAHEFRILRPDMRGMGESTITEDGYDPSLDIFVDDLLSILDHLGVDKVVYVGESFGGIIGLKFAHTPPSDSLLSLLQHPLPIASKGAVRFRRGPGLRHGREYRRLVHCHHR